MPKIIITATNISVSVVMNGFMKVSSSGAYVLVVYRDATRNFVTDYSCFRWRILLYATNAPQYIYSMKTEIGYLKKNKDNSLKTIKTR